LPQCELPKRATPAMLFWGLSLLVLGLFEKVVLADGFLAPVCEAIYDSDAVPTLANAWLGSLAFSGQVYFDFAGYSLCAIGVALCLGFVLPENFRSPYASVGFSEMWRRWHITLTTWLRDYLYFSLGGTRRSLARQEFNTLLTMTVCGLWHGASWNFVAWGAFNGTMLVAERVLTGLVGHLRVWQQTSVRAFLGLATFALWTFSVALFRATDLDRALTLMTSMLGMNDATSPLPAGVSPFDAGAALGICAAMLGVQLALKNSSLRSVASRLPSWVLSLLLATLIVCIVMMPRTDRAFIYFQF
jgi:alginate O-acetyltransferase complex protein AlgI